MLLHVCLLCLATKALAQVESIPAFDVTNIEIVDVVNRMRSQDENKARPSQIELDYQGHTSTRNDEDNARFKLFKRVDTSLFRKDTYEKFIALTDNYDRNTGNEEVDTTEEKQEVDAFLNAIFKTAPWKTLFDFLQRKRHPFAKDEKTFRRWITQLWFVQYSRARGKADTSGFEHVFMGESKNGEVAGMHNWIRFYLLERNASENFDYKGFLIKRFNVMAAVKYTWHDQIKRSGGLIIGSSPEFDMALYTMCFLARRGRTTCDVEIEGCPMSITSYDLVQQRKVFIGTVYPSAGRITDRCRRING
uniref:Endoribonuclease n=1 Tax=Steinernema glaseri TaxID=37863 RepID=A0A1I7YLK0_9BILA